MAQLILRLADSDQLPAHLLIGSDAVEFAGQAEATRAAEAERWREVSVSTDFNASGPLPAVDSERFNIYSHRKGEGFEYHYLAIGVAIRRIFITGMVALLLPSAGQIRIECKRFD